VSGSVAEERIRAKVEAGFRRAYPDARIIHELVIGGSRADVAAVSADSLVLAEIKSERDTLERLRTQVRDFTRVTPDVRIYAAEKHRPGLLHAAEPLLQQPDRRWTENPEHVPELWSCSMWVERDDDGFDYAAGVRGVARDRRIEPAHVFQVLWAEEMRTALAGYGQGLSRTPIRGLVNLAVEHLSGSDIRRAVCAALRRRPFPRADQVAA